jgi:hypothetical protein
MNEWVSWSQHAAAAGVLAGTQAGKFRKQYLIKA